MLSIALASAPVAARAAGDLTELSIEQLMALRVVGASKYEQHQSDVAAAISVLTRADIRAFGWRTIDEALASLPGIHTTYDRQYAYLGTRGFGLPGDYNTRVLVMINGNRVNDAVFDGGPMGRQFPLDLDLVERIEYVPGPGGAVYGQNALFGVVNVITRDGGSMGGAELAAHLQQPQRLGEARASWGGILANGVDLVLSVSGLQARGEDRWLDFGAAGTAGIARDLDGERTRQLFARAARGPWAVDLVHGERRKNDPTGAYLADPLVPGQYQSDGYLLAQARYETRLLDDRLGVQGRLFAGEERYQSQLSYGTPFRFPATGRWYGLELRGLWHGVAGHTLMAGLEAQDNVRVDQYILDSANPAADRLIRSPSSRVGLYLQDEWRLSPAWAATLGMRADRTGLGGTRTSPRAALIWQATPATTLKALYGRAHRAPNAYERDYDDGISQVANPSLRGETIDTTELVLDQRVGADLLLRASLYRWRLRDLVTLGLDPQSGLPQYRSGGDVDAQGLELAADKRWRGGTRLRASVSLQHLRDAAGAPLVNAPQVLARLNLSAPLPWAGLRAGYELRYDSARRTLDGSDTAPVALSNLYLSTLEGRWVRGLELSLGVRNLFGKRYALPAADTNWQNTLEQDRRSLRIEARLRF